MAGFISESYTKPVDVVVMAAGKGTRMKSALPKVLHRLGGRALLHHVLDCATQLPLRRVVVVTGHGAIEVEAACARFSGATGQFDIQFARQNPQLGTGHAVQQAVPLLGDDGVTLILNGDVPLIQAATLRKLLDVCGGDKLALLTLEIADATGYGRVLRAPVASGQGSKVLGIVEHKDATAEERQIREFYTGVMAVPNKLLKNWLGRLTNHNTQKEYYLTDVVAMAVADGVPVMASHPDNEAEVSGVNDPVQLAALERAYQHSRAHVLMTQGVRLADPARFDVRGDLTCGEDVEIDVNCVFEGSVSLGNTVRIGAHCVIANCTIAANAVIHPFTHIDGEKLGVQVGEGARVGPFARLRPGAQLGADVHIGNFVEVKNSTLAKGAKANHLAYLGDATVGERVNIGAGTITANYDGANKHRTVIEADVHIGSNCVLVAPVTVGAGGTVGGGTTLTKNTEPGGLHVARARQTSLPNWKRAVKIVK
jgi:bifunctional UDP-N-acetylglucosamine pyrophosphorylase / glucosamine-1-phosphate N-acetyltransferase